VLNAIEEEVINSWILDSCLELVSHFVNKRLILGEELIGHRKCFGKKTWKGLRP